MTVLAEPRLDVFPGLFDACVGVCHGPVGLAAWPLARLPVGERAAGLGCGAGRRRARSADRCQHVLGVDACPGVPDLAEDVTDRRRSDVACQRRGRPEVTSGGDGRCEVVLSVGAIPCLGDHAQVPARVKSLAAPGGTALLVGLVAASPAAWASRSCQRGQDRRQAFGVPRSHRSITAARTVRRLRACPRWIEQPSTRVLLTGDQLETSCAQDFLPGARIESSPCPPSAARRGRPGRSAHRPGHRCGGRRGAGLPCRPPRPNLVACALPGDGQAAVLAAAGFPDAAAARESAGAAEAAP